MRWLWRDLLRWLSALERVFVDGRVAPAGRPKDRAPSAAQQTGSPRQETSPLVDGSIPDWMRPAFIKRLNLNGSWESLPPKSDELLLENDRVVVFCMKERVAEAQKKFKV